MTFYTKSFPEHFSGLHGQKDWNLIISQTIDNIYKTLTIHPNIQSFWLPKRLSFSYLDNLYTNTYKKQGLIFELEDAEKLEYFPFDLIVLSKNKTFLGNSFEEIAKNTQHLYQKHMIPWRERFENATYNEMIGRFFYLMYWTSNIENVKKNIFNRINEFRTYKWYKPLMDTNTWLMWYNEVISYKPIKIKPLAVFWENNPTKDMWKKFNIPIYPKAEDFLK